MGSVVSSLMGGGGGEGSTGGVGGIDDLKRGLIDQANEVQSGLGPDRDARQNQVRSFTQALADSAAGNGPSLAEQALKANNERNLKMQQGAMKANKAINPALASRQILRAAGDANQQTAQHGVQARLQERNQAQNMFGNFINQREQLAANVRNMAMGGANAQANINQADINRGDKWAMAGIQGASSAMAGMHDGGVVKNYNQGGMAKFAKAIAAQQGKKGQFDDSGRILDVAGGEFYSSEAPTIDLSGMFAKPKPEALAGGPMDNMGSGMQSPYERMMNVQQPQLASHGGVIDGEPVVQGDSPKNDIVPAMLSPGEIVIPRTIVAQGTKKISSFVDELLKREMKTQKFNKGGIVKSSSYGAVLNARKEYEVQLAELNKKYGKK